MCLLGVSLGLGCVAQNPAYMASGDAEGGAGQTDGTAQTSFASTDPSSTAASVDGSGTTTPATGPANTTGTPGSGGTTLDASSGDEATTADRTDVGTESGEPVVILFATTTTPGDFASDGPVADAGAALCDDTLSDTGLELGCSTSVSLVATESYSFLDIGIANPGLAEGPFVDPALEPVAMTYAELVLGDVEGGFANAVTAHVEMPNDPSFWWGPGGGPGDHCQGWSSTNSTGRALTFDSAGAIGPLSSSSPCIQPRHLLCACVTVR